MEPRSGFQKKIQQLIKVGKHEEALKELSDSLVDHPRDQAILNQLSILTYKLKRLEDSLGYSLQFLEINPENSDLYNRVGQIYLKLKQHDKAVHYFIVGLSKNPVSFNLNYNLGRLKEIQNEKRAAIKFFQTAINSRPDLKKPYEKLALLFHSEDSVQELENLIKTAKYNLNDVGFIYDHLLSLLHKQNNKQKILQTYLEIYRENEKNVSNLINIAFYYEVERNHDNAYIWYQKALEWDSVYQPLAQIKSAYYKLTNGIWDNFEDLEKELVLAVENYISNNEIQYRIPVYNLTHFDIPRKLVFEAAKKLSKIKSEGIQPFNIEKRKSKKKLRIGYISPRVHKQANMVLYCGMFEHHDREKFQVYMYALSKQEDEITDIIKNGVDIFRNCSHLEHEEIALTIARDKIDILFTTSAHMDGMRMEVLAYRPAPIIINGQGYNESPAAEYIDYCVVDNEIMTDETKSVYLENLLILSGSAANNSPLPLKYEELSRADIGLPSDKFVFACLCHPRKLHPEHFHCWATILKKSSNSILWFNDHDKPHVRTAIRNQMRKNGIGDDRLFFTGNVTLYRSWNQYPLADLFLDTFFYNSHTVAIEALRMGLPVLTLAGKDHNARYCASILKEAGLQDLICVSQEEYIVKAILMSKEPHFIQSYKHKLQEKNNSLFDTAKYVRKLEKAFNVIWDNYINGYPKQDFGIK